MKLIIGNKNYSSWSLRAWLTAREGGFNFGEIDIPLFLSSTRERILSHSPSGKVPCLNDSGVVVWDSLAIGEYLAEKQPTLLPADAVARATARAVSAEMHAGFRDLRTHMPMNIRKDYRGFGRSPDVDEDIARIIAIWNDCRTRFGEGGPYLFGHFTLADAAFAPVCFRCKTYGLEVTGVAADYLATMLANEHMQEWEAAARAETESIDSEDLYG